MSKRANPGNNSLDDGRRNFLKGATLAGATALATKASANTAISGSPEQRPKAAVPGPKLAAADTMPPPADPVYQTSSGGDFMVDVLKTLDIDYLGMNCASSFRGLHEALINHGGNTKPEIITCPHEEIAVHMGQGYAKMAGKPLATICHGVVGLQHASMAMYNAWCDRVPVIVIGGNIMEADKRAPAEWSLSAIDPAALTRDFVKWDDQPASLQHFAESIVRAYKIAVTPPMAPVMLSLDAELQENPIENRDRLRIPKLTPVIPPQGDDAALADLAKMLVAAENPVIICDRMVRSLAGMAHLVELAEALQCAVIDNYGRMNFPSRHPLNQSFRRSILASADLIVAMELNDLWGALSDFSDRIVRSSSPRYMKTAKIVSIGARGLYTKANYQNLGRYQDVDIDIAGDVEASLPTLIEKVKRLIDRRWKVAFDARGKKLAIAKLATVEQAKSAATIGWDASPITTARLCAELYNQIKDEDWSLVGTSIYLSWPHKLWNFDKPHRWNGFSGGGGVGYTLPSSFGAALANKGTGRLTVAIGGDGDFMFTPSTLWTAAHHRIPLLYIVHNNRSYHQEYMYLQAMAARHSRGITRADIGTTISDPFVDYATLARGFGVYGEGPITDPDKLAPALKRAVAVVKSGHPALLDVVMDQR
ncbi:hypothetical protein AS156_04665 [Bradyrhizobium macuxiense]|uniref:Thiamine pyrophosphate-binding protein n=1 Tax=Bradyrhizobium macuxiense TaxID=1755647 RepID=A0A120FP29_9BRAD|nr:thiamine pyrophosphate-dependent enzyme [Bradyrhizobium macuxiense]KWV56329.1 hypothetical protein AS156_04665 [Bradyrhizobium macuxiense]